MSSRGYLTPNTIPDTVIRRCLCIPNDPHIIFAVNGALSLLAFVGNWQSFGEIEPDEIATRMDEMLQDYWEGNCCMIGAIMAYATVEPPPGVLAADGSQYDRVDYPLLYDRLESVYILNADEFVVPDLRNQFILGAGTIGAPGDTGGSPTHTLDITEIPAHTHGVVEAAANVTTIGAGVPEATAVPFPTLTGSAGGGGAHNNMPPYTALRYGIVAE